MFFIFSKIFSFFLSPVLWILGLLLYAILIKNTKKKSRILITTFILVYLFCNAAFFNFFVSKFEITPIPIPKEKYDCGIVLGGYSMFQENINRLQFTESSDRLFQTVYLYKKGIISKIILSGGSGNLDQKHKESIYARNYLIEIGLPAVDVIAESESKNTIENAQNTKKILDSLNFTHSNLLITSASHLPRSLACFRKLNVNVKPFSVNAMANTSDNSIGYYLMPKLWIMINWEKLIHEWAGFLAYKISGKI